MVMTLGNPVVRVFLYILYPASCASCARMIESRLFFSRKAQAAGYEKKYEHPRTWLCTKKSFVFSCPNSSSGSAQRMSHIRPCVGGSRKRSICGGQQQLSVALCCTYALQVVQCVQLRAQSTVYTQELLVHDSSEGQCAERVHASFVDGLGVLVLALELECEVIGQMPALMVSAK
jgi:hypothetical protein